MATTTNRCKSSVKGPRAKIPFLSRQQRAQVIPDEAGRSANDTASLTAFRLICSVLAISGSNSRQAGMGLVCGFHKCIVIENAGRVVAGVKVGCVHWGRVSRSHAWRARVYPAGKFSQRISCWLGLSSAESWLDIDRDRRAPKHWLEVQLPALQRVVRQNLLCRKKPLSKCQYFLKR